MICPSPQQANVKGKFKSIFLTPIPPLLAEKFVPSYNIHHNLLQVDISSKVKGHSIFRKREERKVVLLQSTAGKEFLTKQDIELMKKAKITNLDYLNFMPQITAV